MNLILICSFINNKEYLKVNFKFQMGSYIFEILWFVLHGSIFYDLWLGIYIAVSIVERSISCYR